MTALIAWWENPRSCIDLRRQIGLRIGHSRLSNRHATSATSYDGRQEPFWAGTYLFKAGLLDRTGRGVIRITSRGLDVLKENPTSIDFKFLRRFPEFRDFQQASKKTDTEQKIEEEEKSETREEMLESSYQSRRRTLAQELLERVKKCSPRFFENLVVDLLVAMGYGGSRKHAGRAIGQAGDGGIDGIIKEDRLGLDWRRHSGWTYPYWGLHRTEYLGSIRKREDNSRVLGQI